MAALQLFLILAIICAFFCISPFACTVFVFGAAAVYALMRPEEFEGTPAEQSEEPVQYDDEYEYNGEDDFPNPDYSFPGFVPDPQTCLDQVAKHEYWAERARECGREDLAEQYENAAEDWQRLYEEADDEEMEW